MFYFIFVENCFEMNKLLFCFFIIPIVLFGQSKKNDLEKLPYDTLKKMYLDNGNNKSKQYEYAKIFLNKAKNNNEEIHIARAYYMFSLLNEDNKARLLDSVIKYSKNNTNYEFNFPAIAYSEKAYILKSQFRFKEAIDNFILAEKYTKNRNIDFYYRVRFSIAILKSEELGEINEALTLYKECLDYYKDKNVRSPQYSFAYQDVLFALADAYKALEQNDSATYYNRKGYFESKATGDKEYNYLFVLNEGANLISKKRFRSALDSINKALPKMIFYKNHGNTLASYYYLGKAYEGLGQSQIAAKNFIKVDSLYKKTKDISPEFISGYQFLINYFKEKNDKKKQFEYLTTFMSIDSTLNKNYKELTKKLQKEYDIPHLISEKEELIQLLKTDKDQSREVIALLFIVVLIITTIGFYQHKLKKAYKDRFEKIIGENYFINDMQKISETNEKEFEKSNDIGISEEIISQILSKLELFEVKNKFLESNITVLTLSKEFDTNTKYLSKIVNEYKGKTFTQYVNDLRIDFAIKSLKQNKILRKYTIQALASEFGFNSAESFSAAFYKKTGIKPTFFIKEFEMTSV